MAAEMPKPGDVIAGKYRVERLLGQGGMGAVFSALHTLTGKRVALKWLLPDLSTSTEAVQRFLREAQVAACVQHPNVVDVYDVGTDDGAHFLVMEYLHGMSLAGAMEKKLLTMGAQLYVLDQAMQGVAAAHEAGVTHRDLKPDNIFLCIDDATQRVREVKVLDFGIAKLQPSEQLSSLTRTGMAFGTPHYMSAEQLRGDKTVDHRTDQYAFGVMLYLVLSGRMPFDADTLGALAMRVATESAMPLTEIVPDIDPELSAIVMRALHRDREQRFATLTELRDLLAPYADQGATLGTPGVGGPRSYQSTPNAGVPRTKSSGPMSATTARAALMSPRPGTLPGASLAQTGQLRSARRRWGLLAGVGAGGVAAAAAVLWFVVHPAQEASVVPPAPPAPVIAQPALGTTLQKLVVPPSSAPAVQAAEPRLVPDSGTEAMLEPAEAPALQPASAERPRDRGKRHGKAQEATAAAAPVAKAVEPVAEPKPALPAAENAQRARSESVRPEVKRVGQIDVEEF
jgi:serine/threonine-protein kinase